MMNLIFLPISALAVTMMVLCITVELRSSLEKPACVKDSSEKVAENHLIFGPPESSTEHPACYTDQTCAQAKCPTAISNSADVAAVAYTELHNSVCSKVYFNITKWSQFYICDNNAYVLYAELRFPGDFDYVSRMCQANLAGSLTAAASILAGSFVSRNIVPLKDPENGGFYFSAAAVEINWEGGTPDYTSNQAANISAPLTSTELAAGLINGNEGGDCSFYVFA